MFVLEGNLRRELRSDQDLSHRGYSSYYLKYYFWALQHSNRTQPGAVIYLWMNWDSGCLTPQHLQAADVIPVWLCGCGTGWKFLTGISVSHNWSGWVGEWQGGKRGNIIEGLPVKPQPFSVLHLCETLSLRGISMESKQLKSVPCSWKMQAALTVQCNARKVRLT